MAKRCTESLLTSKPNIRDLSKYCLVLHKWYLLGIELEIDQDELEKIENNYSDDHMRMIKMFGVWLRTSNSPTYGTLIKALGDIGKRNIAESLCQQLGESHYTQAHQPISNTCIAYHIS